MPQILATDFLIDPPGDLLGNASFAVFDHKREHRFWLVRIFVRNRPLLVVVMHNPSDADETRNDPTISALLHFANMWGYGGVLVVNLHSYATSQPSAVKRAQGMGIETCPAANLTAWEHAIAYAVERNLPVLVAWGNLGDQPSIDAISKVIGNTPTICLGQTIDGRPKHPMARGLHRIPRDLDPQPFKWGDVQ